MKRMTASVTVLAAAAWAMALVPAWAAQPAFHWQGKLAPGAVVEVQGVNGGITASGTSDGSVDVTAAKRAVRSDPDQVKIEVVEHAGGVTICAVYPGTVGDRPCHGSFRQKGDNDVKVDFDVKVPAGVRFVGRTVNGDVTASGLRADAEARTVNGNIELDTTSAARANTVNGRIAARFGRADWNGALKLATVNGRIEVTLPAASSAEVKASTVSGRIESDFPLAVRGEFGPRSATGTLGGGGRSLELRAVNGSIALRKAGS
jgi:hypothetical protein